MLIQQLNTLAYDDDVRGPLRLYIYNAANGRMHQGGCWFRNQPINIDESDTSTAKHVAHEYHKCGTQLRITNSGDNLVFHAVGGKVIYPADGWDGFWKRVQEAK